MTVYSRREFLKHAVAGAGALLFGEHGRAVSSSHTYCFLAHETLTSKERASLEQLLEARSEDHFARITRFENGMRIAEDPPAPPHLIYAIYIDSSDAPSRLLGMLTAQVINEEGFFLTAQHLRMADAPGIHYIMHDVTRGTYAIPTFIAESQRDDLLLGKTVPEQAYGHDIRIAPWENGVSGSPAYSASYPMHSTQWKSAVEEESERMRIADLIEADKANPAFHHHPTGGRSDVEVNRGYVLDEFYWQYQCDSYELEPDSICIRAPARPGDSGSPFYDRQGNLLSILCRTRVLAQSRGIEPVHQEIAIGPHPSRIRALIEEMISI